MDSGKADIIAGIRELRAKAAEQLTGNEYYMIVQQLDSLATSVELSDEVARSVFNLISARLDRAAPAISAAGGPEVPEIPDTPAQPDTPSTPDVPVLPDSPAQPDGSPGPEIPSPPSSPAEPPTPPEVRGAPASAAGSDEPVQIVTPSANSFGMPQATVAIRLAEAPPSEPVPEAAPAAKHITGLSAAVLATRALIEEKLSGNSYYSAANLLGQLQILPPVTGRGEIEPPDDFEAALALLRREAAHLSGIANDEAVRVIAALENVLMPKPQPVPEKPAETAAPQSAPPKPEAATPEAEPEPRTGFDDLAEAAWQRVRHVSAADPRPAAALNGSTPPAPAIAPQAAAPAAVAAEQTEMMAQDIGEAFDDGGSESRSSEPCYLNEFELASAQFGASDRQEPAAETGADNPSETEREAALSAEAEALIALAQSDAEPLVAVEEADVLTVEFEEVTEAQASGSDETVALEQPVFTEAEPQVAELEPEPVVVASEPVAEETAPAAVSSPVIEEQAEPAITAAPVSSEAAHEVPAAEPAPAPQDTPATKPVKRGFLGRLFGGASSEHRR